jgi:DNA mismatch endonuclease (patch repair protein)
MCPDHGTSPSSNRWYWTPKLRRNAERDREVDSLLGVDGWRVVRVWEHTRPPDAADEIERALGESGPRIAERCPAAERP